MFVYVWWVLEFLPPPPPVIKKLRRWTKGEYKCVWISFYCGIIVGRVSRNRNKSAVFQLYSTLLLFTESLMRIWCAFKTKNISRCSVWLNLKKWIDPTNEYRFTQRIQWKSRGARLLYFFRSTCVGVCSDCKCVWASLSNTMVNFITWINPNLHNHEFVEW